MNAPLFDDLLDQLRGSPVHQLAGSLGLPQGATQAAIAAALPVLLGALHRNTQSPGGAQSLLSALAEDHRGIDPANALGNALAGGGAGAAILDHVLGRHRVSAADAVGTASGIGADRSSQLLRLLAPVVMAYLARRLFTSAATGGPSTPHASPEGLRTALDGEVASLRGRSDLDPSLLAELDRDHDGDVDQQDLAAGGAGSVLPTQTAEMRSPRPLL